MKTELRDELQNLVNRYATQKDELLKKNYMQGRTPYRDGIIDDIKDVIGDLTSLLTKYPKTN